MVGDSRVSRSCQRALPDGVGGGQPRVAKAGESTGIIGSHEQHESRSSLLNSDNSSMGVACVVSASAAVASLATASSSPCPLASRVAGAVHSRRTVTPMHALDAHNLLSDTIRVKGPTGRRCTKGGVSGTPSGVGLLVCGAGSHPSCHPGVQEGICQRG